MNIIMILTNAFNIDVRVYKEAYYLITQGHNIEIVCWDKNPEKGLPEKDETDGIIVTRFRIPAISGTGYKQLRPYFKFIKMCKSYLSNREYDYLHCHDLDGAIVGRLSGGEYIFDMHEFYGKGNLIRKKISNIIAETLSKNAKANIYVSNSNVELYGKNMEYKFYPLKNYCDSKGFGYIDKQKSEKFRIAYIGTVRNQIPELTALFEATDNLQNVRVDVYGGGVDLSELITIAENYKDVYIHGPFNGVKESAVIYSNTDVSYIAYDPNNPNYQNEFEPVKLYEAIYTKTPIIATESLNPGKMAKEKGIGIPADTRSAESVKKAVMCFLYNTDFYQKCVNNMNTMATEYNWEEAVKILDKIYS